MNDTDPDDDPTPPRDDAPLPMGPPGPDHPAHALLWLLEQGRRRGFRIGPLVEIGGLRVQVDDLRQAKMEGLTGPVDDMPGDFKMVLGGDDS